MADELNGQALPSHHTNPLKIAISVTLIIVGTLTKLGLFFPMVCFISVFGRTSVEQLYRDKGLHSNTATPRLELFAQMTIVVGWGWIGLGWVGCGKGEGRKGFRQLLKDEVKITFPTNDHNLL